MAILGFTEENLEQRLEVLRAAVVPFVVGVTVLIYARYAARNGGES